MVQFSIGRPGIKMTWTTAIHSDRCCRVRGSLSLKVPVFKHDASLEPDLQGPCSYVKLESG